MDRFSRDQKPAARAPEAGASHAQHASAARSAASQVLAAPSGATKIFIVMLIVVAFVVTSALAVGAFVYKDGDSLVKSSQYQAVFLENGQVYFGQLSNVNESYVQLNDIYYLQVNQAVQPVQDGDEPATDAESQISLAKLGNELHGPEDEMFISRDKIVFWENLKSDGQVTEAVANYVEAQKNQ